MDNHYLKKIIAYEAGQLSAAEKDAFEKDLKTDNNFQEFYQHWQESKAVQDILAYKTLRNQLKEMESQKSGLKIFWKKQLQIAAGILFILFAGTFFYANSQLNNSRMAAQYYTEPNFSPNRSNTSISNYDKAIEAYNYQQFGDCISILQSKLNSAEEYLLAHALYKNQNYSSAAITFIKITNKKDPRFWKTAQWYSALSLLKDKQISKAEAIIISVSIDKNHPFSMEAKELRLGLKNPLRALLWQ